MPLPTLVSNTLPQWAITGASTPPLPTGWAAGDVLVASVLVRGAGTVKPTLTTPADWTRIAESTVDGDTNTVITMAVYAKEATSGETAPTFTSSQTATHPTGAMLVAIQGADLAGVIASDYSYSVSTTLQTNPVTTVSADNLTFVFGGAANDITSTLATAGYTNMLDGSLITGSGAAQQTQAGSDASMHAFAGSAATAGVHDPDPLTLSTTPNAGLVYVVAVPPAAGGANAAPTANAGPDQTVAPGATVTLTGTASTDSDGTVASYAWTQVSGTSVTLSSTSSVASPTFTAPGAAGTLTFSLVVTDDDGAASSADTVGIVVTAPASSQTFSAASAAGWTATGGTAIAVLSDSDDATHLESPGSPTGSEVLLTLKPIEPPVGDFVVTLRAQSLNAGSASMVPTLRTSTGTVLATAATVNPAATAGNLTITFPVTAIDTEVTAAQWRSGTLQVHLAVTAAV